MCGVYGEHGGVRPGKFVVKEPNGNGNGNGKVIQWVVTAFFTVAALMIQAMVLQDRYSTKVDEASERINKLMLDLVETRANARIDRVDARIDTLKATVEQDRADFEVLRESLEPKKKEP